MSTSITVSGLASSAGVKQITLTWATIAPGCSGPNGLPYLGAANVEVWASNTNNRNAASYVGASATGLFIHGGLATSQTKYYWIRPVDASGQVGSYYPSSSTAGVVGTTQNEVPPAGSVGPTQIAPDAVTTTAIADGSISTPKLIAGAVDATKISANAVIANAIAANAVTAGKIAAGSISSDRIDVNGISANHIKTGTLNAGLITVTNLNANSITAGILTANRIAVLDSDNLAAFCATRITSTAGQTHNFTVGAGGASVLILATVSTTSPALTTAAPVVFVELYIDGALAQSRPIYGFVYAVAGGIPYSQINGAATMAYSILLAAGSHTVNLNLASGSPFTAVAPYIITFESRR